MRAVPVPKMEEGILQCISRLKRDQDFINLVEYLRKLKGARAGAAITTPEDVQSRWAAGRAQELNELLSSIDRCDEIINEKKHLFKKPTEASNVY